MNFAEEKTEGPKTVLIFLGIVIDIRIPNEKIIVLESLFQVMLRKTKTTLRELQSLEGTLNFVQKLFHQQGPLTENFVMPCVELNILVILLD